MLLGSVLSPILAGVLRVLELSGLLGEGVDMLAESPVGP